MKIRRRILLTLAVFYIVICAIWGVLTSIVRHGLAPTWNTYSMNEARFCRVMVSPVTMNPSQFYWEGETIVIKEAWVEHESVPIYSIVLIPGLIEFPLRAKTGRCYNLCLNLEEGYELFGGSNRGAFFVVEGQGASFGEHGNQFWTLIDRPDIESLKIRVTDNWQLHDSIIIEASVADNNVGEETRSDPD